MDLYEILHKLKTAYKEEDWNTVEEVINSLDKKIYMDENESAFFPEGE